MNSPSLLVVRFFRVDRAEKHSSGGSPLLGTLPRMQPQGALHSPEPLLPSTQSHRCSPDTAGSVSVFPRCKWDRLPFLHGSVGGVAKQSSLNLLNAATVFGDDPIVSHRIRLESRPRRDRSQHLILLSSRQKRCNADVVVYEATSVVVYSVNYQQHPQGRL